MSSKKKSKNHKNPLVAIIMGSLTDYKIMKEAEAALNEFDIPFETKIISAHRMVHEMVAFAESAHEKKFKVIIAGAGAAAHLPGMVASLTPLPVIGVPVTVNSLKGLDALLSIAQMPKGIPVATVAIDNAFNAGLLAARMLSVDHKLLLKKTASFQQKQKRKAKAMTQLMLKQLAK